MEKSGTGVRVWWDYGVDGKVNLKSFTKKGLTEFVIVSPHNDYGKFCKDNS